MDQTLALKTNLVQRHRHNFVEKDNYLVCDCGKKVLKLNLVSNDKIRVGKRSNNSNYTVRNDRKKYFYPAEWLAFISTIKDKQHRFFFLASLHTGGRIMEVLNLRYEDIDIDRETVTFSVVKQRKANANYKIEGTSRSFFVASNFIKEYKSFVRGRTINLKEYIFLNNEDLPNNYSSLYNKDRIKYYESKKASYSSLLKRKLEEAKIKDWHLFSPHNIRKTYGMWMRAFNVEIAELCYRMGHDIDTFMTHYGSSLMFTTDEKRLIEEIMGDIK